MKKLLIALSLCVFFIGCDDMSKPAMDVISEAIETTAEPTVEPEPTGETTASEIPEITFENVFNLTPGKRYRFRPTYLLQIHRDLNDNEPLINHVNWGNMLSWRFVERADFPTDAPKTSVTIHFEPKPKFYTPNGNPVVVVENEIIERKPLPDEIIVEILSLPRIVERFGGPMGNEVSYKDVSYIAVAIENVTRPDRKFVSEEMPTDLERVVPERVDIPELTFENALNLVSGQRYRFRPTSTFKVGNLAHGLQNFRLGHVTWGNVDESGVPYIRAEFPADAPRIAVSIYMETRPYFYSLDGDPVVEVLYIGRKPVADEIVVEITGVGEVLERVGGERGNQQLYTTALYTGIAIENLTNPDRKFEYE